MILSQAKALKEEGYDVEFAFAFVDKKLGKKGLNGFKITEYSPLPFKNETLQISLSIFRKDFERFKEFDLIICHSFPASYLALKAKKKYGIPYILHLHHPPQFLYYSNLDWARGSFKRNFSFVLGKLFGGLLRKMDSYCVKSADSYFTASKAVERIVGEIYGIEGDVLYPELNPALRIKEAGLGELLGYGINRPFILGSGRIIRQKKFGLLVQAFSKLKNRNFQLVLAGDYDKSVKEDLEKMAEDYDIGLLITGAVSLRVLMKFYNLAEVMVLTCPKEWFGIVAIEAMACGCPVVAWKDNFGPEETVIPRENGFLADPYDIENLAEKIERALNKNWDKRKISSSVSKFKKGNQKEILLDKVKRMIK